MHDYLRKHISEEIEGAIDYLKKAIELKADYPTIAEKFYRMSEMEVEHANCMTKIFNSLERQPSTTLSDYSKMQEEIIDAYTTSMSKIENMKKLYWG